MEVKQWGFYLANIPYWDQGSISFKYKTRPILVYNTSGQDVIALPITSNENKNGSSKGNSKPWVVEVKLEKHSLIKVSKPMTINKNALFKFFGIKASTKTRRKVRETFNSWVVLKELRK